MNFVRLHNPFIIFTANFHPIELIAQPDPVSRMYYVGFEIHITEKYGIIIENWPLKDFKSPGSIGSRLELNTLYHAWISRATRFCWLSPLELEEWQRQRIQTAKAALPSSTASPVASNQLSSATVTYGNQSVAIDQSDTASHDPDVISSPEAASLSIASSSTGGVTPAAMDCASTTTIFPVSTLTLVTKKPRKVRSDKGKPRGSNGRKKVSGGGAGSCGQVEAADAQA
jgi:hypothetical protein